MYAKTDDSAVRQETGELAGTKPFVISRTFDAPIELMFKVWTDPEHMKNWFGPKGSKGTHSKIDFRPGGVNHYCLVSPDGSETWGKMVYREIARPDRIVFVDSFSDEKGNLTRHPLSNTWPLEMLTTVTFEEFWGKTTVVIEWLPINSTREELETFDNARDSMFHGWTGCLDQLNDYLRELKSN